MKPVLLTGASGFVGWHVARLLLEKGLPLRAMVRSTSKLRELDSETVVGDLREPESLRRAVAGCGAVFHVAADYRLWVPNPSEMYQSNLEGTRSLLEAARAEGVERFVYTSTVGCIGLVDGGIGDEKTPVCIEGMHGDYKRSKFMAEQVALEFGRSGFPVVIVNPTAPVGDHDFKPTPTGKIVVDFIRGAIPAFVDTGLNLVDVTDVATGHWLAYERGKPGERYILGCENLTLQRILQKLAQVSGLSAPTARLPLAVAYAAGFLSTALARVTGKEPRVPLDAVRLTSRKMWVSNGKASRDLGFAPGSVDKALERAVTWFRSNGYC
jgi:dihydroflavonol-4-reductase